MIVDCAVYDAGVRRSGQVSLDIVFEAARGAGDSFAWIGLHEPDEAELAAVASEFRLHPLAVEDALKAHQRPKIEAYDDVLFAVLKAARYVDQPERVEIGEVMFFLGKHFVVTVRHGSGLGLAKVRKDLEGRPELLRHGPGAVFYAIADRIVDEYENVIVGLGIDVDEIEDAVFRPARYNHAERIYRLKREVLTFRRAVTPLGPPLERLIRDPGPLIEPKLREYFRDVHDHVLRDADQIDQLDGLLSSVLSAQLTQIGVAQNDDMRKISAWVAIAAVPTMLAGIYGMNFRHMPELSWSFGYYYALGVMGVVCGLLYWLFRRSGWL